MNIRLSYKEELSVSQELCFMESVPLSYLTLVIMRIMIEASMDVDGKRLAWFSVINCRLTMY